MIICDQHRLLYLAPPKTGSLSIIQKLERVEPFNGHRGSNPAHAHHNSEWRARFKDYFICMSIRHPYTRMLSLWRFANKHIRLGNRPKELIPIGWDAFWHKQFGKKEMTFDRFLNVNAKTNNYMRNVWSMRWHVKRMRKPIDAYIRQEHFEEDLTKIKLFKGIDFGHLNKGDEQEKLWYEYFEPRHVAKVQDFWGGDFELFGYNRNFKECSEGKLFV